ncbi:MAG: U32 family peptidase [Ruminococcus sp.]|uniref:peptidase U32 family protein n=1 Tax=Ruminococcus sp. TaxID=41978 RepID=UPI0025E60698|nr:U32 family peptidase [Ruminococcus sp.]MBO4867057.1 U32 family peptidase [Ruminococcus sp.]
MSDLLEILSPVGDMERLHAALDYGADAVYLGGTAFGMRAASAKFTPELLSQACELAHSRGKRVFLTCNTLPHNNEIPHFEGFVKNAVDAGVDALIITDLGLLSLAKKFAPDTEIHISTQAGIVNYVTANEFYNMGAKRVVLARELTLEEIAEIRAKTPDELDIECFVHGAMCVSFSGRCLLSQYLTARDANRGECAQPCRWGYHLMEEKRTNEFYPIFEDERGTFILNAKDMCLIEHIDKLAKAGVNSFKIEGRAKSSYYVSVITNAYRKAMDIYKADPDNYQLPQWLKDEVYKVSHRAYCPGFLFGNPRESQYYENSGYVREYDVVAVIEDCRDGRIYAEQRNKFNKGDEVEVLSPEGEPVILTASELFDERGEPIDTANHAAMKFSMTCERNFPKNSIIRIKK